MRFFNIKRLLLALWVFPALLAVAQNAGDSISEPLNQFDVSLQFMARGESRYGGLQSDEDSGDQESDDKNQESSWSNFVQGRTRLVFDYKREWLEARVSPQHTGVWGQAGKGSFNIFEAWAKLTAHNGMFIQVGRIALSYDDERIIGSDDWAMASLTHDVLRLGYEGHGHKAHAILAYNQNADVVNNGGTYYKNGAQPYKTMQTLWYHYDFSRIPLGVSLTFMNVGMQSEWDENLDKTWFQHLLGGYVHYHPKHWIFETSYYHQFGRDETHMKIDAWMMSTKASFLPSDKYGFKAGYDYLSGDEYFAVPAQGNIGMSQHKVIKGFNPIYGSHHKFYGAMDFFYVSTYVNGFTPGLQNAYIGGFFRPMKALDLNAYYHYLAMATSLQEMNKTLGHEFEFQASYNLARDVRFALGVSLMWGGETMERLKRSGNKNYLQWGWISLSVNPRIFSIKW